jgi:predicted DNA-binding ribbon-helix-helix protein
MALRRLPDPKDAAADVARKRSIMIAGHPTSVSLEPPFWEALKRIAAARGQSLSALVEEIDRERTGNLSSAIRVFVLAAASERATPRERGDEQREPVS